MNSYHFGRIMTFDVLWNLYLKFMTNNLLCAVYREFFSPYFKKRDHKDSFGDPLEGKNTLPKYSSYFYVKYSRRHYTPKIDRFQGILIQKLKKLLQDVNLYINSYSFLLYFQNLLYFLGKY